VSLAFGPPGPQETRRLLRLLSLPAAEAAPLLLGKILVRRRGRRLQAVRLVETEAYLGIGDPAAHASHGRTARTEPLWGVPGTVYVYFIYGMYHCLNLVTDRGGAAGCVLIRAAEPQSAGMEPSSCRGPGRLCRSLGLDTRSSGTHLFVPGSELYLREGPAPTRVGVSPRVGVRLAAEESLRFFDAASPAVSAFRRSRAAASRPRRQPAPRRSSPAGR
jgi:DNA-3-methyladenine glycosylase